MGPSTMEKLFSVAPTKFEWEYAEPSRDGRGAAFKAFSAKNSGILEKAFKDQGSTGSIQINVGPGKYDVRFDAMTYTLLGHNVTYWQRGKSFEIRRSEVVSVALRELRDVEDRAHAYLSEEECRRRVLEALFDKYATDEEIGFDVVQFAEALGTDASTDVAVLVLAFYGQCEEMGEFTGTVCNGMARLECDTEIKPGQTPKLRSLLEFRGSASPSAFLKMFWEYLYFYFKEKQKKRLPMETAVAVMDLVLGNRWDIFPKWKAFCEVVQEKAHFGMSKMESIGVDEWRALLRFAHKFQTNEGLEDAFEADDEFWTEIFDVFVGDFFASA